MCRDKANIVLWYTGNNMSGFNSAQGQKQENILQKENNAVKEEGQCSGEIIYAALRYQKIMKCMS